MTESMANAIWDVLVEHAGAWPDDRESFVARQKRGCVEYRFCGLLGFGGKFWAGRMKVSCYREDETEERRRVMDRTNAELAKLLIREDLVP